MSPDLDLDALDRLQVAIRECLSSHIGFEDTPGGKYAFTTLRLAGEQIPVLVAALRGAVEERNEAQQAKEVYRHRAAEAILALQEVAADVAALTEERDRLRAECDAVKALHERFETEVEARCTSLEAALTRLEERSAAGAAREAALLGLIRAHIQACDDVRVAAGLHGAAGAWGEPAERMDTTRDALRAALAGAATK